MAFGKLSGDTLREYEDYAVTDDMVLLKREFDFVSNHKEENIRGEQEGVSNWKFPVLIMFDFEFVKRDKNTISTPVVKEGNLWDFAHVKHLCGNGCLYVRLVTSREDVDCYNEATLMTSIENVVPSPSHVSTFFVCCWLI